MSRMYGGYHTHDENLWKFLVVILAVVVVGVFGYNYQANQRESCIADCAEDGQTEFVCDRLCVHTFYLGAGNDE